MVGEKLLLSWMAGMSAQFGGGVKVTSVLSYDKYGKYGNGAVS